MPADLQHQARALGEPTRYRIFRYIVEAARAVGVGELTEFTGLNHNAVRQHLAVLTGAGLVTESLEDRQRPGRPRLLYALDPAAAGSWDTDGPYRYLARLLAEALSEGLSPIEVGRRAGRAALVAAPGTDSFEALAEEMARRGFEPEATPDDNGCEYVLNHCPFEDAAALNPDVVCEVHRGLAEGLAASLGDVSVTGFSAGDPHAGGCCLAVGRN